MKDFLRLFGYVKLSGQKKYKSVLAQNLAAARSTSARRRKLLKGVSYTTDLQPSVTWD